MDNQNRKKYGFTVAELMVLLLFATIMMAILAPVGTRRKVDTANGLWKYTQNAGTKDIYFTVPNSDANTVRIGEKERHNTDGEELDNPPKLVVTTHGDSEAFGGKNIAMLFKQGKNKTIGGIYNGRYNPNLPDSTENSPNHTLLFGNSKYLQDNKINKMTGAMIIGRPQNENTDNQLDAKSVHIGYQASELNPDSIISPIKTQFDEKFQELIGKIEIFVTEFAPVGYHTTIGYSTNITSITRTSYDHSTAIGANITMHHQSNDILNKAVAVGYGIDMNSQNGIRIGNNAGTQTGYQNYTIGYNAGNIEANLGTNSNIYCIGNNACSNDNGYIGNFLVNGSIPHWLTSTSNGKVYSPSEHGGNDSGITPKELFVLGDRETIVYIPGDVYIGYQGITNNIYPYLKVVDIDKTSISNGYSIGNILTVTGNDGITQMGGYANQYYSIRYTNNSPYYINEFSSDRRLKHLKGKYTSSLDKIDEIPVVEYKYKNDPTRTKHIGVIAQDLQKIFPSAVTGDDQGFLQVRTEEIFYAVVNAIKDLNTLTQKLITKTKYIVEKTIKLNNEVKALEEENQALKKQLTEINERVTLQEKSL